MTAWARLSDTDALCFGGVLPDCNEASPMCAVSAARRQLARKKEEAREAAQEVNDTPQEYEPYYPSSLEEVIRRARAHHRRTQQA